MDDAPSFFASGVLAAVFFMAAILYSAWAVCKLEDCDCSRGENKHRKRAMVSGGVVLWASFLWVMLTIVVRYHEWYENRERLFIVSDGFREVQTHSRPVERGWFGGKRLEVHGDDGSFYTFPANGVNVTRVERNKGEDWEVTPHGKYIGY